jgi:hypothetical protein
MTVDSKLRSFFVLDLAKYNKFREIQAHKGKNTGQRLNELIENEVKESDPNFINNSPIKTKKQSELTIPNPFAMENPKQNAVWKAFLATLSYEEWRKMEIKAYEINAVTEDRKAIENYQKTLESGV